MHDSQANRLEAHRLEMRWVQVTGPDGRSRMEARWIDPARAQRPAHAA